MSPEKPPDSQRDASPRSAVVWASLALLAALGAAGWWAAKTRQLPRALIAPQDSDGESLDPPGIARDSAPGASEAGVVRVRVVDANDGAALEGIEVELIAEEPLRRRYGRLRSDRRGEVRFQHVYAPLVLAQTRRDERFAAALTLARGEFLAERTAILRLGSGGTLSGRVIDDTGAPVEGAAICLIDITPWPDPAQPALIAAHSGPDGAYRVDRVIDLPRTITLRDGETFAAAWAAVIVEARSPGGVGRSAQSVHPCMDAIAPDISLPRPPTLSGKVLDCERQPVAGALVSVNRERQMLTQANLHVVDPRAVAEGVADLPGSKGFALREGEALTADDGSFTLVGASLGASALVVLDDGRLEGFACGPPRPGGRIDGLEFVLAEREVLRMRLFDADDRPILGQAPTSKSSSNSTEDPAYVRISPIGAPQMTAWAGSKVELFAELGDGSELRVQSAPFGDGTFSFALAARLSAIERLSISAPGYKTRVRECHGRLRQESVVANEHLERLDNLELRFECTGELEDSPGSEPQDVQVRACALSPEAISDPSHPRPVCCGFGMFAQFQMTGRERTVAIPMQSERPFWLTLRTSRGGRGEELVAGPFRAGEGVQTIEIPALPPGPSPFERPIPTAGRSDPRAIREPASASLCVFDAEKEAALSGAEIWVLCDPLGREAWLGRTWTSDADGCATLDDVYDGRWTFVIGAPGHRALTLGPVEISSAASGGAQIDLGPVRLAPVH